MVIWNEFWKTHPYLVKGLDTFSKNWSGSRLGDLPIRINRTCSNCAWAKIFHLHVVYAWVMHDRFLDAGNEIRFWVCGFRNRFQMNFIFWMFQIILVYHQWMAKVVHFGDQHRVCQRQNYTKTNLWLNSFIIKAIQVVAYV